MRKLETVPFKTPLDPRTNQTKTMNKRSHIIVFLQTTPISCYFRSVHFNIYPPPQKKRMTITMGSHQASCKYRKKIATVGCDEIKDGGLLGNGRLRYLSTNNDDTW